MKSTARSARAPDTPTPSPLRERMRLVREEAIVDVVNRLLADKGYDFMTVDEVAAEVGMAKASLYKHFPSKEALAAAAMVRVLERALTAIDQIEHEHERAAIERLHEMVRWTLRTQYDGRMPALPAQNSTLRALLTADKAYMNLLLRLSDRLGAWITQAQRDGEISRSLPPEVVLFTFFARACDPVLPLLKASGQYSAEQIFDWMIETCFTGLAGLAGKPAPRSVSPRGSAAPAAAAAAAKRSTRRATAASS